MSIYQAPLVLRLRRSNLSRVGLAGVGLMALTAIAMADLPTYVRVVALLAAGMLTWQAWRAPMPLELKLNPDGRLHWRAAASSWQEVSLLPSSTVTPWLCVLVCRPAGQKRPRHFALYPDSLSADDFRRLRVWLRWRARIEGTEAAGDASART